MIYVNQYPVCIRLKYDTSPGDCNVQVYVNQQLSTLYSPPITLLGRFPAGLLNLDVPDSAGSFDMDMRVVNPLGLGKLEVMGKLDSSRVGCFRPVVTKDGLKGGTVEPVLLIGIRLGPEVMGWDARFDLLAVFSTGLSETVTRRGPNAVLVLEATTGFARMD